MRLRRSTLFVPSGVERFYERAAASGADAVVLDLEDSVAPADKQQARDELPGAAEAIAAPWCVVRVNADPDLLTADLAAAAAAHSDEVLLPKVESPEQVGELRHLIALHHRWQPELSILIESLSGLQRLPLILEEHHVSSVALGMEDLAAELVLTAPGRSRPEDLAWLHGQLLLHAGAAAVLPLGLLGPIGNFSDLDRFAGDAAAAWRSGYRGTYCIHPAQVPVANRAYAPDDEDLAWAIDVLAAATEAAAEGRGSVGLGGMMVDAPTVARARRIIDYRDAVSGDKQRGTG